MTDAYSNRPDLGIIGYFIAAVGRDYFNFSGRARRKEYWSFILVYWLIAAAFSAIAVSSGAGTPGAVSPVVAVTLTVGSFFILAMFIPSLSVTFRRLHDSGRSGWWLLLAFAGAIPLVGIPLTIWFVVLLVKKSEPGRNDYGPQP